MMLTANAEISGSVFRDDVITDGIRNVELIQGFPPTVVFVLDVSGSADNSFDGSPPVGDMNSDGKSNRILDGEIAGFIALNQYLIDSGYDDASVSIVVFGTDAAQLDMNPSTSQMDLFAPPSAVVETVLRNVVIGGYRQTGQSAAISFEANTNFEAPLAKAINVLQSSSGGLDTNDNVIFLSDGNPNRPTNSVVARERCQRARGTHGANLIHLRLCVGDSFRGLQSINFDAAMNLQNWQNIFIFIVHRCDSPCEPVPFGSTRRRSCHRSCPYLRPTAKALCRP